MKNIKDKIYPDNIYAKIYMRMPGLWGHIWYDFFLPVMEPRISIAIVSNHYAYFRDKGVL